MDEEQSSRKFQKLKSKSPDPHLTPHSPSPVHLPVPSSSVPFHPFPIPHPSLPQPPTSLTFLHSTDHWQGPYVLVCLLSPYQLETLPLGLGAGICVCYPADTPMSRTGPGPAQAVSEYWLKARAADISWPYLPKMAHCLPTPHPTPQSALGHGLLPLC